MNSEVISAWETKAYDTMDLADKFGVPEHRIYAILNDEGVAPNVPHKRAAAKPEIDVKRLCNIANDGASTEKLCLMFGISETEVWTLLRKHNRK